MTLTLSVSDVYSTLAGDHEDDKTPATFGDFTFTRSIRLLTTTTFSREAFMKLQATFPIHCHL
jgi:hypothetical protein